eukprot:gnl/TRDRNA2_/TRDRNA2_197450_c0_seq1.p1 gnl/TRDRNA2_/TRDRNA2_197450_c0~~gnl/TRDRNA2_/TRDRNA2_197450_c0_seq1.p1  ORF type:complete len:410 (-),score=41.83 gnl/TRDRNA2_/TRDRNA2_197450_c0_seq1:173-1402(-)
MPQSHSCGSRKPYPPALAYQRERRSPRKGQARWISTRRALCSGLQRSHLSFFRVENTTVVAAQVHVAHLLWSSSNMATRFVIMFRFGLLSVGISEVLACSHFTMENDYTISARTEDLPGSPHFTIITRPRGSKGLRASKYGYVGFVDSNIRSGLNDAGLNCDKQTLDAASHPGPSHTLDNIDAAKICQWALEGYGSVHDMKIGLTGVNFVRSKDPAFAYGHWAFRDAVGEGVVIEFTNHTMKVFDDNNDGGKTGYGIMTNDPPFPEHLRQVEVLEKEEKHKTPPLQMPGGWGSVDRFNRIFLIKSNLPKPNSSEEALMQAVHTLNSISVPSGDDFFGGFLTQWSVVYDHKNRTLYWRSHNNQNLQRIRLADAGLAEGHREQKLSVNSSQLPWFADAAALLHPEAEVVLV